MGNSSPENDIIPGAQGVSTPEGSSADSEGSQGVEESAQPAGWKTTARVHEDGPVIWEAPIPPRKEARGSPRPRGTGGADEGGGGVGGSNRSRDVGERPAPGPDRAKATRAGVSFWRAT